MRVSADVGSIFGFVSAASGMFVTIEISVCMRVSGASETDITIGT